MSEVTAVVLSPRSSAPPPQTWGVPVLMHVSRFDTPAGLLQARKDAIAKVDTPWFFFMDLGDRLPLDPRRALQVAQDTGAAVVYTNEVHGDKLVPARPYDREQHRQQPMFIHRLAMCRTDVAQRVAAEMPSGDFAFEPIFYWLMAEHGAVAAPYGGYHWRIDPRGFSQSTQYLKAILAAHEWVKRHGK